MKLTLLEAYKSSAIDAHHWKIALCHWKNWHIYHNNRYTYLLQWRKTVVEDSCVGSVIYFKCQEKHIAALEFTPWKSVWPLKVFSRPGLWPIHAPWTTSLKNISFFLKKKIIFFFTKGGKLDWTLQQVLLKINEHSLSIVLYFWWSMRALPLAWSWREIILETTRRLDAKLCRFISVLFTLHPPTLPTYEAYAIIMRCWFSSDVGQFLSDTCWLSRTRMFEVPIF